MPMANEVCGVLTDPRSKKKKLNKQSKTDCLEKFTLEV